MTVGIISCQTISGNLAVLQPLTLINRQFEQVKLQPKTYQATIALKKRHSTIELRLIDDFGFKQNVNFHIPEHLSFPEGSGKITVPSSENNQPWNLTITTISATSQSEILWGYEPCYTNRCRRPYYRRNDRYRYWEDGTCRGEKQVEYYYRDTVTDLDIQMTAPGKDTIMAVFKGQYTDRAKIYTFEGPCY